MEQTKLTKLAGLDLNVNTVSKFIKEYCENQDPSIECPRISKEARVGITAAVQESVSFFVEHLIPKKMAIKEITPDVIRAFLRNNTTLDIYASRRLDMLYDAKQIYAKQICFDKDSLLKLVKEKSKGITITEAGFNVICFLLYQMMADLVQILLELANMNKSSIIIKPKHLITAIRLMYLDKSVVKTICDVVIEKCELVKEKEVDEAEAEEEDEEEEEDTKSKKSTTKTSTQSKIRTK